jgi:probable phosphoglycerate mutase
VPSDAGEPVPQPGRIDDQRFGLEVLLIRHGESKAVVPGSPESVDPPLSDRGREQAGALADRLRGKAFTAVYSSDLERAAATARAFAGAVAVVTRPDLREVHLGDWENGEFRRRAAAGDPDYLAFVAAGRWDAIPNAEVDEDVRARMHAALTDIAATHPSGSVAVVCHSGVINAWLAHHTGSRRSMVASIDNTSITQLRTDGERWLLLGVNDRHHLGDPVASVPGG